MSYILEALKKSEQERNPDRVPDLSTHHEQMAQPQQKSFPWVWLIVAIISLNMVVLYWLFFNQPTSTSEETVVEQPKPELVAKQPDVVQAEQSKSEAVVETSIPESATPGPVTTTPTIVIAEPEPVVEMPVAQQQPSQPPRVLGFDELPHVSELSLSIQNQLPSMEFSTHIYVEDGGSFVIINNQNLSGGMTLGSGLILERIVREGVVMSFRSRYFTLRSMESWTK